MSIRRAFAVTFICAVVIELVRLLPDPGSGARDAVLFAAGYLALVVLGALIAHGDRAYRSAFALTLPFIVFWFAVGMPSLLWEGMPESWTAEDAHRARQGYFIATMMFAPVAFLASGLGVWLGRRFNGVRSGASGAA